MTALRTGRKMLAPALAALSLVAAPAMAAGQQDRGAASGTDGTTVEYRCPDDQSQLPEEIARHCRKAALLAISEGRSHYGLKILLPVAALAAGTILVASLGPDESASR